jgi:hypothetical protein
LKYKRIGRVHFITTGHHREKYDNDERADERGHGDENAYEICNKP